MAPTKIKKKSLSRVAVTADDPVVSVDMLLRHSNFSNAARLYVRMNLDACGSDVEICKIFGNAARHVAFSLIATMSARSELVDGAPPLTPTRLIDVIEQMGLSSHGKIEAMINRMVDRKLISRTRLAEDRRFTILQPSEAFLAIDAVLCAIHANPSALLVDDRIVAGVAAGDRAATRQMRAAAMPLIEGGGAMLQRVPQMAHFLLSDAGWLILFALVDAIWREDIRGQRFEAIARQCGVTRPHVRNVLTTARDYGILEERSAGLFAPTAAFFESFHVWIAECLVAFISCCQLAQSRQTQAPAT